MRFRVRTAGLLNEPALRPRPTWETSGLKLDVTDVTDLVLTTCEIVPMVSVRAPASRWLGWNQG